MNNLIDLQDVDDIICILKECDDAYFNSGESKITDREYDTLKRRAFLLEPSNDYFIKVGSDVRGGKTKLPYPMGSLNQIYEGEAQSWVNKYMQPNDNVVITDKLDGVSVLLVYNNDKLSIAYSRGNGIEGADVTRHVKKIKSMPTTLDAEYLVVRAEIIMSNTKFSEKYSTDFKNPRNLVAGVMNRKDNEDRVLTDLSVIAYEIVACKFHDNKAVDSKEEMLKTLSTLGFSIPNYKTVQALELNDEFLVNTLRDFRANTDYELDGLVVTVDLFNNIIKQSNSSSINPEYSVKFKTVEESSIVETFVQQVHWDISKSGYIKPRVEILPVNLFGTTVRFATGFNYKFINDNGIGPGAKVRITKAGMTIPYLVSVIIPKAPALPSGIDWEVSTSGVEAVVKNADHPEIIFKQVLDFFETYKIDLLREATLRQLWSTMNYTDYDNIICDICDMTESEWVNIVGANGSRIYNSIKNRMLNSLPETFLGACRYMGIGFGVRKSKALLKGCQASTIDDVVQYLQTLTLEKVIEKDGFDNKTASMVLSGIPKTLALLNRMISGNMLSVVLTKQTTELSSVNVVMTGFRDADLQSTIESMGGKVGSGVSKKTTHLLCMDVNSGSSKMEKAKELGICIMTPDEFRNAYNL